MENLSDILLRYKKNMDRQRELDDLLLVEQSKEEWIASLQKRAEENQRMYVENDEIIQMLEVILEKELTEQEADLMYQEAHSMYWDGYDDCQLLLPMLYKLEEYYTGREKQDIAEVEKLLFVYGAIYYEVNEVQNRREGVQIFEETYNYKIMEYRDRYFEMTPDGRRRIWGTYYNIIVSGFGNKVLSVDESYEYYKEAMAFWESPAVQEMDGDNEEIQAIIERIVKEWLITEEAIEESSPETKAVFCKLAGEVFTQEMQEHGSLFGINSEAYAAYLHAEVIAGKRSMDEAIDEYLDYYNKKLEYLPEPKEITEEDFYFIINTPIIIEGWLKYGSSEEKQKSVMGILKGMTKKSWYQKLKRNGYSFVSSPFLNELMAEWCFKIIQYLDHQDEKEELLFLLLVQRQLPTYLHSVMVQHLAEAVYWEAKRSRPELFMDMEAIRKEELLEYIRQCALLHDIGKTRITDIVNTQGRKLWDREFVGIKKHPEYGAKMLSLDPDLKKYHDVAMGHHRFYDGSYGYPQDFDNTASPYRIIIDLITICDCIDAATDHLGRNYKRAKSLEQVLEELAAGKGTRYNPDLVEMIENSPKLKREMQYIVSEGRLNAMYGAYLERVE